jgi:predicted NAD/FAD-binding protein
MRIAVVGAGVSGLVAAHVLQRAHEIVVFEADHRVGGHAHTVRVDTADRTYHVDTGFIVFNDRNYPRFQRLLELLGVRSQPSRMSFSVSAAHEDFEYAATSPAGLYATPRHLVSPAFQRMVLEVPRFQREARALLHGGDERTSLRDWLAERRFSRWFVERLIVPQAAAVWSADPRQMWSFPARFLAQFFANHGMLGLRDRPNWRTVTGGSIRYVEALTAPFRDRIRIGHPVTAVARDPDGVTVTAAGAPAERFDHVVIATHSDQARRMLTDATDREHELLTAIPYRRNEAVLHTDERLLPRRRRAWASWNYHLLGEVASRPALTYWMNNLQSLDADREFCVTLNRTESIDPSKVIATIPYAHPVYTPDAVTAQRSREEICGAARTHFCGAYWGWGFHEDGVASALRVTERFGLTL